MAAPKLLDVTPFAPIVIKAHYDHFDWKHLKPICEKMINDSPVNVDVEDEGGRSSVYNRFNQPHMNDAFRPFYSWLHDIAQHILKNEWDYLKEFEYSIANSWVNVHNKGGITKEHHHGPAILVAATYLNLPEDGGYIEFKDPNEYVKGMNMHNDLEGYQWKRVKAVTGDVLLFPGWIRHRTEPSRSNEDRWVLTTNIMSMYRVPMKNGK